MPSVYQLKSRFQDLLRPFVRVLATMGVTANQVTTLTALLSIALGLWLLQFDRPHPVFFLVPVWLFQRMALNAIDGMLAREHQMKTPLGAFLNELGDVVSDAMLYLGFARLTFVDERICVLFVLLAILSEMTGVIAVQVGARRRYDGPMGKSDRALVIGVMSLLIALNISSYLWVNPLLILVCLLTLGTIINRVRNALKEVSNASRPSE